MASAKIVEVKPVEVKREIVLTLSEEEASILKSLVGAIYGDTKKTDRKFTSSIYVALDDLGITAKYQNFADLVMNGHIEFPEYDEEKESW